MVEGRVAEGNQPTNYTKGMKMGRLPVQQEHYPGDTSNKHVVCIGGCVEIQEPENCDQCNWTGDCATCYLSPPLQMFRTHSMTGIARGVWRDFNKRSVSNSLIRYKAGYHSSARVLILSLGVAKLEGATVNIAAEI